MIRIQNRRGFLCAVAGSIGLGEAAVIGPETRRVRGKVSDRRGIPLEGAVVQIENTISLAIRTYITDRQGAYHFAGLSSYVDYKLRAKYRGVRSSVKRVSQFDARPVVIVDLEIPTVLESVAAEQRSPNRA